MATATTTTTTTTPQTKNILAVGLTQGTDGAGRAWTATEIRGRADALAHSALSAGYAIAMHMVDPPSTEEEAAATIATALRDVRARLAEKDYDGVLIGYALRAQGDLTGLFQGVVNLVGEVGVEKGRAAKLVFPVSPPDTVPALDRCFRE